MMERQGQKTFIYPDLGSLFDLGFVRVSGAGLGNCFFTYFHSVILAEKTGGTLIFPAWPLLKIGAVLRREENKRLYWGLFRPAPNQVTGAVKYAVLAKKFSTRHVVRLTSGTSYAAIKENKLNLVQCQEFVFSGLHRYRDDIRRHLLMISTEATSKTQCWGKELYIAVHIRMGDFAITHEGSSPEEIKRPNTRIPLSWYVDKIECLRKKHPDRPILVFSDGHDQELMPLIQLGATVFRSGSGMADLLKMASASLLVGSNSTYSYWAAFLGNMPSVWVENGSKTEKITEPNVPEVYASLSSPSDGRWIEEVSL